MLEYVSLEGFLDLVVGSHELLNFWKYVVDMITVDETFFKVGAAVVSIFSVYRVLLFGTSLLTRTDPKAGNEDPAEAELSRLKSKSFSISSLAIWVGLEDEI